MMCLLLATWCGLLLVQGAGAGVLLVEKGQPRAVIVVASRASEQAREPQNDFRYFKSRGVWGFWTEGQNCWMVTHLNYYIRSRLMWNARADVPALVRDYCQKFYGSAARPVEDYIWTMEKAVGHAPIHHFRDRPVVFWSFGSGVSRIITQS